MNPSSRDPSSGARPAPADVRITSRTRSRIPTERGGFTLVLYETDYDADQHMALILGEIGDGEDVLVRVHSECFTGDVLGSLRCDCGRQLEQALSLVAAEGRGVVVYLRQEGRGIGLLEKLRAYNLQDEGLDTVDANLALGHGADERDYTMAAVLLRDLGVRSVRLLTNNPAKMESLAAHGFAVRERVPLGPFVNAENAGYLATKARRMRHILPMSDGAGGAGEADGVGGTDGVDGTSAVDGAGRVSKNDGIDGTGGVSRGDESRPREG